MPSVINGFSEPRLLQIAAVRGIHAVACSNTQVDSRGIAAVVEPNRLRDQVHRGSSRGPHPPPDRDIDGSQAALASRRPWGPRHTVGVSAFGEVLIVAISTPLILSGPTAWIGIGGWLIANVALGAGLALIGGGRPTWGPLLGGVTLACLASGVVAAGAELVGVFPKQTDTNAPPNMLLAGFLVTVVVFIFAAPIALVGAVIGGVIVDTRTMRRHSAVARGDLPFYRPTEELENRSRAAKPLDDLGLAKVTADGAATTVVREYPLDGNPDALLAADKQKLAAIGYAVYSVVRRPAKSGLGWSLLSAVLFVVDLAEMPWLSESLREWTRGFEVVTFKLTSLTHSALTPEPFVAEEIDQPRADPIAEESERLREGWRTQPTRPASLDASVDPAPSYSTAPAREPAPTGRRLGWLVVGVGAIGMVSLALFAATSGAPSDPNDPGVADVAFVVSPIIAIMAAIGTGLLLWLVGMLHLADVSVYRARNAFVAGAIIGPISYLVILVVAVSFLDSRQSGRLDDVVSLVLPTVCGVGVTLVAALGQRRHRA